MPGYELGSKGVVARRTDGISGDGSRMIEKR
jgi:hypothetical protein